MHIFVSMAVSKDKQTLETSEKHGVITEIEDDDAMRKFLGWAFTHLWDVYRAAQAGISEEDLSREKMRRLMQHPYWGWFLETAAKNARLVKEQNLPVTGLVFDLGVAYHEFADLFLEAAPGRISGNIIKVNKVEEEGAYCKVTFI